jgi:hypothetical protein
MSPFTPPHLKLNTHYFYCVHCLNMKRIFLSTKEEEKESWVKHHSPCQPSQILTRENWSHSLKDHQARNGRG